MSEPVQIALVIVYGYLLGSVNSAFLVGKLVKGIDLRKVGSGTVGASNVFYHVGRFWIFPVGIFDVFAKGMTPVYVARYGLELPLEAQAAAGLMAVVGHNWPVFLHFHGGRGIAPTVGMLMSLARPELVMFIVIATAGWRLTNSSAVWVLISIVLMPTWAVVWGKPSAIIGALVALAAIAIIKRLTPTVHNISGQSYKRLMLNRLFFDRDIADHDAWVRREQRPSAG